MIGWCTECKTVAIEPIEDGYDVRCFDCRYPLVPRPTPEYNTVDLAELWRERKRQTFARTAQFLLSQQK